MKLDGIHHISAITGDARRNVDFYTRVLGLRLVAKSVNQDDPSVYHLFYGDEVAHPGADMTFFEYPYAKPGRAGAGMIHRIVWRAGPPGRRAGGARGRRALAALRRPRGPGPRARGQHLARRAADRRPPGDRRRRGPA